MRDILNSHSASALRKEIAKTNIKGYTKMNKSELVNVMMKHKERFSHLKHSGKSAKSKKEYKSKEFVGEEDNVPDKKKKEPSYKASKKPAPKSTKRDRVPGPPAVKKEAPKAKAKPKARANAKKYKSADFVGEEDNVPSPMKRKKKAKN